MRPPKPGPRPLEQVDIGGRALRIVRAGPDEARPLILLECGAFGSSVDWAEVQSRLARQGLRSLAYDRAGLGYSDPGPMPRDGEAILADIEAMLAALGETQPLVFVGHSMGGLFARLFARRHPERTLGVVLVDAATAETIEAAIAATPLALYRRAMGGVGLAARLGFSRPVSLFIADMIGLTGAARIEKRLVSGAPRHAWWSTREVQSWADSSRQGREAGPYPTDLPVAAVLAGGEGEARPLKALQAAPALASRRGLVEYVKGANHASLLGPGHADAVVRGVNHVLRAAGV